MSKKPPNLPSLGVEVKGSFLGFLKQQISVQTSLRFALTMAFGLRLNAQLLAAVKGNLTLTIALLVAIIAQS